MFDDHTDALFVRAETHWAAKAARGRIDAINAAPNLHWLVETEAADTVVTLTFDTAPSFPTIVAVAQAKGIAGMVRVRSVRVGRKRPRPLVLLPWQRVRTDIAAE